LKKYEGPLPLQRAFIFQTAVFLAVARTRLEAIAAIHRLVAARLERNFRNAAALAAGGLEHFTALSAAHTGSAARTRAHLLARRTAIGTTVRLVLEAFAGIELLLTGSKCELPSAVHTIQHFINVHLNETPYNVVVGVVRLA
jgi:hypothetical protein